MVMDCKSVVKKRGYLIGLLKCALIFWKIRIYDFKIQARKENESTRSSTLCGFYLTCSVILCFLSGKLGNMSNPFINLVWSLGNFWVCWSPFMPGSAKLKNQKQEKCSANKPDSVRRCNPSAPLTATVFYLLLLGNQIYKILETQI
jgi:hypothetical protein